jgi:hypothetical protein
MDIETAAALLDVSAADLTPFDAVDTFNEGNALEGFLCRHSDYRYGALVLTAVNGAPTSQVIFCTPKLRYPFGRTDEEERIYHFPEAVRVEVYDKYDGTNICAYCYWHPESGERFVTFKTRLTPVLESSKFGPFVELWNELLQDKNLRDLVAAVKHTGWSRSFEMYGYRNVHLIIYDVPLAAALLFEVSPDGAVHPPPDLPNPLVIRPVEVLRSPQALIEYYNKKRADADAENVPNDDGQIAGTEGYVFYVIDTDGRCHQFKCKPDSIEELHWSSDFIPKSVILPTIWNSLESCPEPSVDEVKRLLLEEFTELQVNASHERICKLVAVVVARLEWRESVRVAYEALGIEMSIEGKGPVMNGLSKVFDRGNMRGVYTALKELGIADEKNTRRENCTYVVCDYCPGDHPTEEAVPAKGLPSGWSVVENKHMCPRCRQTWKVK